MSRAAPVAVLLLSWPLVASSAVPSGTGGGSPGAAGEACLRERVPIAKREFQDQLRGCGGIDHFRVAWVETLDGRRFPVTGVSIPVTLPASPRF